MECKKNYIVILKKQRFVLVGITICFFENYGIIKTVWNCYVLFAKS